MFDHNEYLEALLFRVAYETRATRGGCWVWDGEHTALELFDIRCHIAAVAPTTVEGCTTPGCLRPDHQVFRTYPEE
jgi:hypothetical protein